METWKAPNGYAQEQNSRRQQETLYVRRRIRHVL